MTDRAEYFAAYRAKNRENARAYSAAWRVANKQREKEMTAKYREENKDALKVRQRLRYALNADTVKARNAAFKRANRDSYRIYNINRREKLRRNKLPVSIVSDLMRSQKALCVYCHADLHLGFHVDHILPFALGGENVEENVQLLCPPCNMRKNAKHPDVFRMELSP